MLLTLFVVPSAYLILNTGADALAPGSPGTSPSPSAPAGDR
jgi:hypothetical protein